MTRREKLACEVIAKKKINCGSLVTITYESPCERENRMHTIEVICDGASVGIGEYKTIGPCFTYLRQLSKLFDDAEKVLKTKLNHSDQALPPFRLIQGCL